MVNEMQVDCSGQREVSKRPSRPNRVAHATFATLLAGADSLMFSLAIGLQDTRWAEVWTGVGHASTPFSTQESGGPGRG